MCVIIYKPKYILAEKELMALRHKSNSDSWGFATKSVIENGKGEFDFFWESFEPYQEEDVLIHFRTATSGTDKNGGRQPIITNGCAFFLNGNLKDYFGKKKTDTVLYAEEYLDRLPSNFLERENIRKKIEEDCIINNAVMAFMDSKGKVHIFNEDRGVWEKGMWFSNPRLGNYSGFGFSGIYPYKDGEKRNNI